MIRRNKIVQQHRKQRSLIPPLASNVAHEGKITILPMGIFTFILRESKEFRNSLFRLLNWARNKESALAAGFFVQQHKRSFTQAALASEGYSSGRRLLVLEQRRLRAFVAGREIARH